MIKLICYIYIHLLIKRNEVYVVVCLYFLSILQKRLTGVDRQCCWLPKPSAGKVEPEAKELQAQVSEEAMVKMSKGSIQTRR